jgi:hypothetical protein
MANSNGSISVIDPVTNTIKKILNLESIHNLHTLESVSLKK